MPTTILNTPLTTPSTTPHSTSTPGERLTDARGRTDALFDVLNPDAIYDRPVAERHRLIFYLGHFEAFDWNLLGRRSWSETAFHPEFDRLFERGIDPAPGQAPADSAGDWPSRNEVEQYGAKARAWVDGHLDELDPFVLQMAIEHRYMHAETFAYLMHGLSYDKKAEITATQVSPRPAPANPLIPISGGAATLGKTREHFGWDNEHLAHQVVVPPFSISKFKISNGEYVRFVQE